MLPQIKTDNFEITSVLSSNSREIKLTWNRLRIPKSETQKFTYGSLSFEFKVDSDLDAKIYLDSDDATKCHLVCIRSGKSVNFSKDSGWFKYDNNETGPYTLTVSTNKPIVNGLKSIFTKLEQEYNDVVVTQEQLIIKLNAMNFSNLPFKEEWQQWVEQSDNTDLTYWKNLGITEDDTLFENHKKINEMLKKLKPWMTLHEIIGQDDFEDKIKHLMEHYEKNAVVVMSD